MEHNTGRNTIKQNTTQGAGHKMEPKIIIRNVTTQEPKARIVGYIPKLMKAKTLAHTNKQEVHNER